MKKSLNPRLSLVLMTIVAVAASTASAHDSSHDGLLVDLVDDISDEDRDALAKSLNIVLESAWGEANGRRYLVKGTDASLKLATAKLRVHPNVESVEPNVVVSLFHDELIRFDSAFALAPSFDVDDDGDADEGTPSKPDRFKPNDPMYKHQWHMDMVNAEQAWARTQGAGVIVAVLDTGVSPGKIGDKKSRYKRVPDLKETEIVAGYNFIDNNNDPSDGHGHGTHVSGTIAQSTNNGFGVAGLAPKAKIMPIKVLSDRGFGSMGAITSGIRWAADHGAKVINMSLGGGGYSASMAKAIKYAHDKGVTIVCAAGNGGRERVEFPAAYEGAFAVSALGPDGKLAFYSSYGKELDIAAPGGDTRVDLNKDGIPDGVLQDTIAGGDPSKHGFFPFQGTSMATPHVAAAAALVVSTGVSDPDRVEKILRGSARNLNDKIRYGAGSLDAFAAVSKAQSDSSWLALLFGASLFAVGARRTRRRESLVRTGPMAIGALVMSSSGFFALHALFGAMGVDVGAFDALLHPLALMPMVAFGAPGGAVPFIVASAAVVLAPMLLFFGVKRARGLLAGLAFGVAGFLLSRAVLGEMDVGGIPGHGFLDAAWLSVNAMVCVILGRIALIRD